MVTSQLPTVLCGASAGSALDIKGVAVIPHWDGLRISRRAKGPELVMCHACVTEAVKRSMLSRRQLFTAQPR